MSITRSQMEDILENALIEMEKYAQLVNLDLGSSNIFKKANDWIPSETDLTLTGDSSNNDELNNTLDQQQTILNAIQEITQAILDGAPLNQILVMVMETIYSNLNFHRVIFCFINKGRTSINARYGFGPDIETIVERFSIPNGGDDIFNLSLKQAKDLIIEDIPSGKADNLLPKWYKDKYTKKSMMVCPIVVKNIPMGVLYADSILPITEKDVNRLNQVKTLRNQIILAIRQSS